MTFPPRRVLACLLVLLCAAVAGCGGAVPRESKAERLRELFAAPGVLHFEGAPRGDDQWNEYWVDLASGHWRGVSELPAQIARDDTGACEVVGDPTMEVIDVGLGSSDLPIRLVQRDVAPLLAGAARHPRRAVLDGRVELGLDGSGALTSLTYRVRRPGHRFSQQFQLRGVERLPADAANLALTRIAAPVQSCG